MGASVSLNPSWMLKADASVTSARTFASLRGASRSLPLLLMRTRRTTRGQSLIDQLQGKVKSYKKQIEEAEEIAALNLAKYRKVAGALGDAEAAADANEQAMAMRKVRAKSASLGL